MSCCCCSYTPWSKVNLSLESLIKNSLTLSYFLVKDRNLETPLTWKIQLHWCNKSRCVDPTNWHSDELTVLLIHRKSWRATSRKTIRKSHVTFFVFQSNRVWVVCSSTAIPCIVTQRSSSPVGRLRDTKNGCQADYNPWHSTWVTLLWYLPSVFQCCFGIVFRWTCPSSRPTLRKGKKRSSTACQRYSFYWPKF